MIELDIAVARRFILGKQGLWPGRRWRGVSGTEQAMRAMEHLQLDPLQIIARSQDLALAGRVIDYTSGMWEEVCYGQRNFFDWGAWLAVRPMDELPYWRTLMRRQRESDRRLQSIAQEHAAAIDEMRTVLRERGVVSNRDFDAKSRRRVQDYRGRKDSALALYYLWRTGEAMIHHRENFERVYAPAERVAPARLMHEADELEANRFFIQKEIAFFGLARFNRSYDALQRGVPFDQAGKLIEEMLAGGDVAEVRVEGWKAPHLALAGDVPLIEELAAGRLPEAWKPLETATDYEAVFLAPLDPVIARGRAKPLFGFEYVWEVYKPKAQRKFGYYTLPVLWGDRLAARFDSKLDRSARTLHILGFWLEEERLGGDEAFAEALARGFGRFLAFLEAERLDASAVGEPLLRKRLAAL